VDVGLTSEQELLVAASTRFIEDTYPLATVRSRLDQDDPGADYCRRAADLGWYAMLVPEAFGGGSVSGNGLADAALIGYTRGAALQPQAFVATNVVAFALATGGTQDHQTQVLPGIVSGAEAAAWAVTPRRGPFSPETGVAAEKRNGSFVLSGSKMLVQDAHSADWLLVTASSVSGPTQFLVPRSTPGVTVEAREALDLTRRFDDVVFDQVEVPASMLVGVAGDHALVDRQLQLAAVLTTAETVGAMDRDFEMAVQYAKDRIAFGRPIGSFQAVKHLLADTSLMLEMSKSLTWSAARSAEDTIHFGEMASAAKAFVGDSGIDLTQNCFQVFAGIGFTWEHDQHLYLRRIATDRALYGDPSWHRERICRITGL
jgi:alkylation response protein AidB-like acyl-CoA dehydrogenase